MKADRTSHGLFLGLSALLFAASATVTIAWSSSASAMAGMPMPGESWAGAAASFAGMWVAMMPAMMLPSLVPALWRYRRAIGAAGEARGEVLTALVGAGYFLVWTALGVMLLPVGVALSDAQMLCSPLARAVPVAAGAAVFVAGALQFTRWKAHLLACCREAPGRGAALPANAGAAWRYGLRLGVHCAVCCAGLTATLLVIGVMDLRAMAAVAAAITFERLAPAGWRPARVVGLVGLAAGIWLIAQ